MSNVFSIADAEKQVAHINVPLLVKHYMEEHKLSHQHLSKLMGKHKNYITQQVNRKNTSLALLHALSVHLQTNLFEPFQNLLPENLRTTKREQQLQQQIDTLNKQLADVSKERDLLKEIVMK